MATTALVVAVVVAAVAAGASAYMASEAAAQQQRNQQKMAKKAAEAERAAGEARERQIRYDAERKRAMIRSREAAAGVQIGQGSLLEEEMQFAADADYAAQMARYPHALSENLKTYEASMFGAQAKRTQTQGYISAGLATGSTLASGYASYSRSSPTVGSDASGAV